MRRWNGGLIVAPVVAASLLTVLLLPTTATGSAASARSSNSVVHLTPHDTADQCVQQNSIGGGNSTNLSALYGTDYRYNAPADATSVFGSGTVQGFPTWYMILTNFSGASVPNPTLTISSGLDPSVFDGELPTPSFPSSCSLSSLPARTSMIPGTLQAPSLQQSFSPGFDSTRSVSPSTVPAGGGDVTVTVTATLTNSEFAGGPLTVNLTDINYPGVSLVSYTNPTNLGQGESIYNCLPGSCSLPNGIAPSTFSLQDAQLNKHYTFTAVVDVANPPPSAPGQTAQPWSWLPSIFISAASNVTNAPGCTGACGTTGSSVTVPVSSFDGSTPGAGAITFSVGTSADTWDPPGVQPTNIVYYPESPYPPPLPTGVSTSALGSATSATTHLDNPVKLTQTVNGVTTTVSVPANALPADTTVSLYPLTNTAALEGSVPAGKSYVVASGVSWVLNGTTPTASSPITMTITDPSIAAGDVVYQVTSQGALIEAGTATANGTMTITFTSDPTFIMGTNSPKIVAKSARAVLNGTKLPVKLRCEFKACKGIAELTQTNTVKVKHGRKTVTEKKTLVLAKASYRLAENKTETVNLVLNTAGKSVLAKAATQAVRGTLALTVTGGVVTSRSFTVT